MAGIFNFVGRRSRSSRTTTGSQIDPEVDQPKTEIDLDLASLSAKTNGQFEIFSESDRRRSQSPITAERTDIPIGKVYPIRRLQHQNEQELRMELERRRPPLPLPVPAPVPIPVPAPVPLPVPAPEPLPLPPPVPRGSPVLTRHIPFFSWREESDRRRQRYNSASSHLYMNIPENTSENPQLRHGIEHIERHIFDESGLNGAMRRLMTDEEIELGNARWRQFGLDDDDDDDNIDIMPSLPTQENFPSLVLNQASGERLLEFLNAQPNLDVGGMLILPPVTIKSFRGETLLKIGVDHGFVGTRVGPAPPPTPDVRAHDSVLVPAALSVALSNASTNTETTTRPGAGRGGTRAYWRFLGSTTNDNEEELSNSDDVLSD